MTWCARRLRFALGLVVAASARAEEAPRPGIFAPQVESPRPAPPSLRRSATSPRLSGLIAEQLLAKAQVFEVGGLVINRAAGDRSTVLLEKVVVQAVKVREVELGEDVSPLARFVRSGALFDRLGKIPLAAELKLLPVRPAGALPKEEVMRAELLFRFTW